jgi:hypothetical protein
MKRRDAETRKKNGALQCDSASLHALYARDRLVFHSPRLCASAFHSMLGHTRRPPFLRAMRILLSLLLLASALTAAEIRTVASTGTAGDGGPAKDATLSGPKGISVAPNGNVYVADTESHSVRVIDMKMGALELIAGTGANGDGPPRDAADDVGDPLKCKMVRLHGVFVDKDGSVFIGDSEAHRVLVVK